MAHDSDYLANFATDGYADNGVPRNQNYEIPDIILGGPYTRKIKILSIGASIAGITSAYHIQKHLTNVEHVMYEKNHDVGGSWLVNRYPGCGCDVPSHAYSFPFAPNPDWPRYFSTRDDICGYLSKVCDVLGLREYIHFNCEVVGCYWQQDTGEWHVHIKETQPDGSTRVFKDQCHMLLQSTGVFNYTKWPDVEGMDKFNGKIIHTARWPDDYQEHEWEKDRVAMIGSGASSVQAVPAMQPYVKHMHIFVRTGIWFVSVANNFGINHEYSTKQKQEYRDPYKLVGHAKSIEDPINEMFPAFMKNSKAQATLQPAVKDRMAKTIKDERLLQGFTPTFGVGCRRVTPGDPYMKAIQKENVHVHFTAAAKVTEKGVVGDDGVEREVDTIICATGFDNSYRPRFPIVGQNGIELANKWKEHPEGYLGLAVPGFPNFITFIGPSWPIGNGSIMGPVMYVSLYALQLIEKLQTEYVCSIMPKQDVTDAFNNHVQEWFRHTVWVENCRSWYKNHKTGRVNAIWPGSSLHYIEAIRTPRYEDFDITYLGPAKKNMWAFLGMGTVRGMVEGKDMSPYFNVDIIDPDWAEATGIDLEKVNAAKVSPDDWARSWAPR